MARRKKTAIVQELPPKPEVSRTVQIRLAEIARKLGTSVSSLIEDYGSPEVVIERFDSGSLQLLNEEDSE